MNICCLIGNLANDPELRHTSNGKAVATFRLAVNKGKDDGADFFTIICWDRQAEVIAEYCAKGRKVGVEGRIQQRSWETDNGDKRSVVEIVAHRIDLLGSPGDANAAPAADAPADDYPF
jgi:single-strand DNA-binding protein